MLERAPTGDASWSLPCRTSQSLYRLHPTDLERGSVTVPPKPEALETLHPMLCKGHFSNRTVRDVAMYILFAL